MSTVKANDLQTTTGGIPTVKGQKLIPTAWVNFNGTGTVAIRDSENVSSITDAGTGTYTVNFSVAMSNSNYSPCLTGTGGGTSGGTAVLDSSGFAGVGEATGQTTTSFNIRSVTGAGANINHALIVAVVLGGQA